ncbi:stealth family protein [Vagococcus zengguangii]|uniref:stealth family protein n=1 Tax=Vagococcus zengguangii TaxID=2571750 RepID=UPI0011089E9C|nr:stealth family protein [Vagococcus zengguangii]TLG81047.1 capsule biosynthesis protein CapG [Vagococcus zengguangii]
MNNLDKIDFVITWVDGSDKHWIKKKKMYDPNINVNENNEVSGEVRYRDWELLKFWFRSIEKNANWVNKVYLITDNQVPDWINETCSKLEIVFHTEYIPSKYLPTFNSRVIELNFHKIKGLSEQFVYFNDDMFILNPVKETDFFHKGKPKDMCVLNPITPIKGSIYNIIMNNMEIINDNFNKNRFVKENFLKIFSFKYKSMMIRNLLLISWPNFIGFYEPHATISHTKTTYSKLWDRYYEKLDATCSSKFRENSNLNHWLMRYWNLCNGEFHPQSKGFSKFVQLHDENISNIKKDIINSKVKLYCINDSSNIRDFNLLKSELIKIFSIKFPEKSIFEK